MKPNRGYFINKRPLSKKFKQSITINTLFVFLSIHWLIFSDQWQHVVMITQTNNNLKVKQKTTITSIFLTSLNSFFPIFD